MPWHIGMGFGGSSGGGSGLTLPLTNPSVSPFLGTYSLPSPLVASGGAMQFAVVQDGGAFTHQVEVISPFYQDLGHPPTLNTIYDLGIQPAGTPIQFRMTSYHPGIVNIQINDDTASNYNGLNCGPGCMNWTLDPASNSGADIVLGFEDLRGALGFTCASSDDGFEDIRIVLSGITAPGPPISGWTVWAQG